MARVSAVALRIKYAIPFEDFSNIREVHFDAMLVLVGLSTHVAEFTRCTQFLDSCVAMSLLQRIRRVHQAYCQGPKVNSPEVFRTLCTWRARSRRDRRGARVPE
jgi:hypothetical protein